MRIVYADEVLLLNFILDYLVLTVTARVSGGEIPRARIAAAAAVGGVYAALSLYKALAFLCVPLFKLAVGALLPLIAFGGLPRLIRKTLIFFAMSAAFGGAVLAAGLFSGAGVTLKIFLPAFAACYIVLALIMRRAGRRTDTVDATVEYGGRSVVLKALIDSGNSLSDPITGAEVLIADGASIAPLLPGDTAEAVLCGGSVSTRIERAAGRVPFRLIPYATVGGRGTLIAFRPDRVTVDGRLRRGMLVALSETEMNSEGYSAIVKGEVN